MSAGVYDPMEVLRTENFKLKAEVERLREALMFYSDTRRYQGSNQRYRDGDDSFTPHGSPYLLDAHRDNGQIARAALAPAQPEEGEYADCKPGCFHLEPEEGK